MLLSAFKEKNVATILTRYQHKASNPSIRVAAFPNTVSAIPNLRSSANFQHQIAISILNISAPQAYPLSLSLCSARMHPRVKPLSYIEICWPPSIPSKVSFSQTHPQCFFFSGASKPLKGMARPSNPLVPCVFAVSILDFQRTVRRSWHLLFGRLVH